MISEEQEDEAALYALGLLGADEGAAFESELRANAELRDLVRELREAAGNLALTAPSLLPPASLKRRIMGEIAIESKRVVPMPTRGGAFGWIPWAIAAALAVFCGLLAIDRVRLKRQLADIRAADPLMQTRFYTLAPSAPAPTDAKATVAWQPGRQSGVIRISNLPAPE